MADPADACVPLKRNRYFTGKLLNAADFQLEQDYILEKHRLHNRMLHGWGIVEGLGVSVDGSKSGWRITVERGYAIDCCGREICLPEAQRLERAPAQSPPGPLYLVLSYAESPVDPLPVPGEPGGSEEGIEASHIQEDFTLTLEVADPCAGHTPRPGGGGESCAGEHGVTLGKLAWRDGRWKLGRYRRMKIG